MNESTPPPRLESSLRAHFVPALRKDGFVGTGRTFRRIVGDIIQVCNVQGSYSGGRFAVNLAIQPACIPDVVGNMPDPNKIMELECVFRKRLSESRGDQWWQHDGSRESMDAAVISAVAVYCSHGRPVLDMFCGFASPLGTITPDAFENGHYDFHGFGNTKVLMALALALYRKHHGDSEAARRFASIGLAMAGPSFAGRRKLQDLIS